MVNDQHNPNVSAIISKSDLYIEYDIIVQIT